MKSMWTALSVIAVANLLALAAFVGWLKSSDRLDASRLRQVRQMFTKTLAQQKTEEEEAARAKEQAEKEKQAEEKRNRPPLTATEQLTARLQATEIDVQRVQALKSEVDALRTELRKEREQLEKERAEFEGAKKAFDARIAQHNQQQNDEQFKKAVSVLELLKASEAKTALVQIIERGPAGAEVLGVAGGAKEAGGSGVPEKGDAKDLGKRQVVAYLNALKERTRAKVLAEFSKDDPALAAELLERLRTHGVVARAPEKNAP